MFSLTVTLGSVAVQHCPLLVVKLGSNEKFPHAKIVFFLSFFLILFLYSCTKLLYNSKTSGSDVKFHYVLILHIMQNHVRKISNSNVLFLA